MILRYIDGDTQLDFTQEDFPLALGLTTSGAPHFGKTAEASALAWLRYDHDRLSIQPQNLPSAITIDGTPLAAANWLIKPCLLSLGTHRLDLGFVDGRPIFTRVPLTSQPQPSHFVSDDAQARDFGRPLRLADGRSKRNRPLMLTFCGATIVLAASLAFVLSASPITIDVTPQDAEISLSGGLPALALKDRYLALPGRYHLTATAPGHRLTERTVEVDYDQRSNIKIVLEKLPGLLSIKTDPDVSADIRIDGREVGQGPLSQLEVSAGSRVIEARHPRYLTASETIEVEGRGIEQQLRLSLSPAWGDLQLSTEPEGALVRTAGRDIGVTPLGYDPLAGRHEFEFVKEGWKPAKVVVEIAAGQQLSLPSIKLQQIDGPVSVTSDPPGAIVSVNGAFHGQTPVTIQLSPEQDHQIRFSKQGYADAVRNVRPIAGKATPLAVRLEPQYGTLFLTTTPAGANLRINGQERGAASQRLQLQTLPQTLEITLPGYEPYKTTITPRAGLSSKLDVVLRTASEAAKEQVARGVFTKAGQRLALVSLDKPVRFSVGSSRREAARRSNESEYPVELTRNFYVSEKEITNAEFLKFRAGHKSGNYQNISLDQPNQPVVNVTWEDAARYANWLSKAEGLVPAYKEEGDKVLPIMPLTNGYRLPTEAEWEFMSRYEAGKQPLDKPLTFPWGDSLPPTPNSGNYADDGAQRLGFFIPGYSDGQAATAPVGTYPASRIGLFDIGGNVSEWCHDFYDIYAGSTSQPLRDPAGPANGRFHVVKGSSWRSGSVTELRLSYRDYADKGRDDIGFRIVRYAETKP